MNPALVDFVYSLCYYMVYPLCARIKPAWHDHHPSWRHRLLVFGWLLFTAAVYWILEAWFIDYRSNPLSMVSEDFAGRGNSSNISLRPLLQRSYAQVLGGASGVIIDMIVPGWRPQAEEQQRQLRPERLAVAQVVISMLFFIVGFNIEAGNVRTHWAFKLIARDLWVLLVPFEFVRDRAFKFVVTAALIMTGNREKDPNLADEKFERLLIDLAFAFAITVAFEVTDAYEKGIYLNPAHKLAETLTNKTIGREDFFCYWSLHIFLGLLFLAMGRTLVQAITMGMFLHQISIGVITVGLIFRFMNEALSYITWGRILYCCCPFIVAMISGVLF